MLNKSKDRVKLVLFLILKTLLWTYTTKNDVYYSILEDVFYNIKSNFVLNLLRVFMLKGC